MADHVRIKVTEAVGANRCVDTEDGHKLNSLLAGHIEKGDVVHLSFFGVSDMITAFMNAAVGQLYNEFPEQVVRERLVFEDVDRIHQHTISKAIIGAKEYFRRREQLSSIISDVTGDDE